MKWFENMKVWIDRTFIITRSSFAFLGVLGGLALGLAQVVKQITTQGKTDTPIFDISVWIGGGAFSILVLLIALEFLYGMTLLVYRPLGNILAKILGFLNWIISGFKFVISNLAKFLLRDIVRDLFSEFTNNQTIDFTFQNQNNTHADDHYYPKLFGGNNEHVSVEVSPKNSQYWRLGFVLSKNEQFLPSARHGTNYPLFHLTKDLSEDLKVTYYDELAQRKTHQVIEEKYVAEKVTIDVVLHSKKITFKIFDKEHKLLTQQEIVGYKFFKLFAWGDGHAFVLETRVSSISLS